MKSRGNTKVFLLKHSIEIGLLAGTQKEEITPPDEKGEEK